LYYFLQLSGNKYTGPEDFLQDVALVFTNAIRFNRDGRDIGDPLSCAYYDASVHLLKYARWLSFEIVTDYITESDRIDKNREDGLPPFSWSLTTGNRKQARKELEGLVLKETIDISLEGDRWTWHEAECEKLLKALRHQSDVKYMGVFIATDYPLDYAAYISKPMDWEKVHRTLKKRRYHTFGDFIEDLRLIFTNALKYNAKHQGMDNDSGRVYEAAIYMSQKLEAAINKMLLTVSDRLERERIDHSNAEREIEATERAEEAQIRASWKKPTTDDGQQQQSEPTVTSSNLSLKIRNVRRVEQNADFEIPFFDEEDDGRHESSYFEVVKVQKALFERQRAELLNTRKLSKAVGAAVFGRHIQNQMAKLMEEAKRKQQQQLQQQSSSAKKGTDNTVAEAMDVDKSDTNDQDKEASLQSSSVLKELERSDRGPVTLQLNIKKPSAKKRRFQAFDVDDDDDD
jgi:Bromodomain